METNKEILELKETLDKNIEVLANECSNGFTWNDVVSPLKTIKADENKTAFKKEVETFIRDDLNKNRISNSVHLILSNLKNKPDYLFYSQEFENAGKKFTESLQEMSNMEPEQFKEDIITQDQKIFELQEKNPDYRPPNPAQMLGISSSTIQAAYEVGVKLFAENNFEDAVAIFLFLSSIDNYNDTVWISLGLCHLRLHEPLNALQALITASQIAPNNPLPYFYLCECYIDLHDPIQAKAALDKAETLINKDNKNQFDSFITFYKSKI